MNLPQSTPPAGPFARATLLRALLLTLFIASAHLLAALAACAPAAAGPFLLPALLTLNLTIDGSKSAAGEDGKWCWSIHDGLRTLPLFADDGEKRDRWMGALAKYAGAVGVNLAKCSKEHALFPCNACSNMVPI